MKRMTVALLFCAFAVGTFVGCGGEDTTTKKTETKKTETKTEEKK